MYMYIYICISIYRSIYLSIYLYDYEADFIVSQIKTDKPRAIKFKNASHSIDNECILNDSGEFF